MVEGPIDHFFYFARTPLQFGLLIGVAVPGAKVLVGDIEGREHRHTDGIAAGGGCAIAAACDLRICSDRSRFGVPIARTLGNCLSASNYARFLDLIGPTRLKEMLFTGRLFDSEEAKATGFVTSVVAPDVLEASVKQMAETIAANAPLTIRSSKEMIRRVQEHRRLDPAIGHDLIRACYSSNDFKEGVLAFLQKRTPRWNGT